MKLGRNGISLFPRRLTRAWSSFSEDYVRMHEEAHLQAKVQAKKTIGMFTECPWNTNPKNIDEFLEVCDARADWEKKHNASIPLLWNCTLSHSLFEEIAREVKEMRNAKRNS
jgi:hypothetical protein